MIQDTKSTGNVGILLVNETDLQRITEKSGNLAVNNEYQVHYWALVVRNLFDDGSVIDIAVPTVYFNYTQTVSGAHINFITADVDKMSTMLKPLHDKLAQLVIANENIDRLKLAPTIEFMSVPMNSMHRHPGGATQSFSGTDYSTNKKDTGIVFPLSTAHECPNFASIMAHSGGKTILAHTEYRLVFGDINTTINYFQGRCMSFVHGTKTYPTQALLALGIAEIVDTSYYISKFIQDKNLVEAFKAKTADFVFQLASTDFVDSKNLAPEPTLAKTSIGFDHSFYADLWSPKTKAKTPSLPTLDNKFDFYSAETKGAMEHLELCYGLVLHTPKELENLALADLMVLQEELLSFYIPNSIIPLKRATGRKDLIAKCLELSTNIIEEVLEELKSIVLDADDDVLEVLSTGKTNAKGGSVFMDEMLSYV